MKRAWLYDTVEEYDVVRKRAVQQNKQVHFGKVMALCHIKNAQLGPEHQRHKGRIVFRGDDVKDQEGAYAVFNEQGTSASHLAAAKFLDAVARMPGMDGHDSDATSAYTQCELGGPLTWVT